MQLKGKTALISGAGRNNGKAIALTFAREGADVILIAREREDSLNEVARECESYGVKTLPLLANVGNHEEVNRVVTLGLERFGKVDVLACVAATRDYKPFGEYTYAEWQRTFSINVHSTFYLAKALAPGMIARKSGTIVALGAVLALRPGSAPKYTLETACKHSLYGLIKSIALDLGPHGIRANFLALEYIENKRLNPGSYGDFDTDPVQRALTPLGRMGTNQEVANAALFLASDQSSFITGDRIVCAGGRYM